MFQFKLSNSIGSEHPFYEHAAWEHYDLYSIVASCWTPFIFHLQLWEAWMGTDWKPVILNPASIPVAISHCWWYNKLMFSFIGFCCSLLKTQWTWVNMRVSGGEVRTSVASIQRGEQVCMHQWLTGSGAPDNQPLLQESLPHCWKTHIL